MGQGSHKPHFCLRPNIEECIGTKAAWQVRCRVDVDSIGRWAVGQ